MQLTSIHIHPKDNQQIDSLNQILISIQILTKMNSNERKLFRLCKKGDLAEVRYTFESHPNIRTSLNTLN